jgi:O-antigen ligase
MSAWPSQPGGLSRRSPAAAPPGLTLSPRRFDLRATLLLGCLICVLIAEGVAVTQSYLLAAPLLGLLLVLVAIDLPLASFLGVVLLVRVLTDASLSSSTIRHSGSLNLSGGFALLFILVAAGLVLRRRQGLLATTLALLWLGLFTAVAVSSQGASTETIREGVREASIAALAVIAYNSRGALNVSVVTRLLQVVGIAPALLAIYQLGTHSGLLINGQIRSNGTFTHPNSAAMFFAIATTASVWRYLDRGRRRSDALFAAVFAAATLSTFSLGGLAGLLAMLMAFGSSRPGSYGLKVGAYVAAALIVVAFLATPLGAERIAQESSTKLTSAQTRNSVKTSSLAWRLYKWGTLISEWEQAPILGKGLGTTVTAEGTSEDAAAGKVPHNEYVRYLVETGVVGLASLLWGAVILIRRLARRRGVPGAPDVGTLGLAIVIGCMVNSLADNTFLYSTTGYAAALIVGAVLAVPCRAALSEARS